MKDNQIVMILGMKKVGGEAKRCIFSGYFHTIMLKPQVDDKIILFIIFGYGLVR
ncbi:hypothetical protein GA0116948_10693 [Chitinophaga costaii]|uniref:Uncharacterized protein n=1 Tax=Chitinophaga costaii TaxID=1335309 RepID=A0A1C4DT10_9BACT|nr:hypothetical protein [Chitinophaga costaii]SCC34497.1 hypothetical protein GA0116948_10693 [Chitinophaga costaii]